MIYRRRLATALVVLLATVIACNQPGSSAPTTPTTTETPTMPPMSMAPGETMAP